MSSITSRLLSQKNVALRITAISSILMLAWFWTWQGPILCIFHALTGLECPGCGMTRAFHAIMHGHLQEAVEFNLLSPILFYGMLIVFMLDLIYLASGTRVTVTVSERFKTSAEWSGVLIVLLYGILRNLTLLP